MIRRFLLIACSVLLVLQAACIPIASASFEIDMKAVDRWDATIIIVVQNGLDGSVPMIVEESLAEQTRISVENGVRMEWERKKSEQPGYTPFEINLYDASIETIEEFFFGGSTIQVVEEDGERRIYFQMDTMNLPVLQNFEMTLKGKRVIATNGEKVGSGTVRWKNPSGKMQAVMVEGRSGLPIAYLLLIAGTALVGAAVTIAYQNKKRRSDPYSDPVSAIGREQYCPHCYSLIPTSAAYCPVCGKKK